MRIVARKAHNDALAKRERLMQEHLRADPLRMRFPQIEQLECELTFSDPKVESPPPSPQRHTLFPAAPAFFRFACPSADCDGDFDLTDAVAAMVKHPAGRKLAASVAGQLSCQGVRFRDHAHLQASCQMVLSFQLLAKLQRAR